MWIKNDLEQLIEGVMRHGPDILDNCVADPELLTKYLTRLDIERLNYPTPTSKIDSTTWFIPKEYQDMDVETWLVEKCPAENYERLVLELDLFQKNNMMPVLKTMMYVVDTLRRNNVIWGVGRGSSVASYVLYLIGVHKVDSIKYNLPIEEFFKGE